MMSDSNRMDRRDFLRLTAAMGAAAALPRFGRAAAADKRTDSRPDSQRPNFILIMADDCSAKEFSCYGSTEMNTPNIDGLAKTGVMFRTCWCTPICGPTRAMLMTGRYGFRTGWYHNDMKPGPGQKGYNLAQDNKIFAQVLRDAGYATGMCGKWQLRGTETEHGFQETMMHHAAAEFDGPIEPPEGNLPGRPARYWHPAIVLNGKHFPTTENDYGPDLYVDFINDFARRHKDQPFLMYYSMPLTHLTWDFDRKKMGYVAPPELDANGNNTGRKGEPSLKANVEYVDHLIGRIVHNLDELGLRDRTILLFTCDNGTAGYGKGNVSGEQGPRVPLIVNGPGYVKAIGPSDELASLVDVFATMADLGKAETPKGYVIDGVSLAPIFRGEKGGREWIFSYYLDKRMLRDKRWLLDGEGRLWDCGDKRDGEGYVDVADSADPEAAAARRRFEELLKSLPAPSPDDPVYQEYAKKTAMKKARKAGAAKPRPTGNKKDKATGKTRPGGGKNKAKTTAGDQE